ncbi:hypothetical protein [Paenibacillus sp. YN15]|uniref:hypothetical protein n=1 Tax=Paenibacillus sp. YN15 TaxID=1742774 RepID=UPI000DCEE404|nr:hypothetical protein [Paenibacillus sp. YN15]RAV03047.1 hypothetical protein DQG13_08295 [Paenibacillus sp. YN15]
MFEKRAYIVPDEEEPLIHFDPENVTEVLSDFFRDFARQRPHAQVYHGPTVLIGKFFGSGTPPTGLYGTFTSGDISYRIFDSLVIKK